MAAFKRRRWQAAAQVLDNAEKDGILARHHGATVTAMNLMPDGRAVTGGGNGVVCVRDLARGEQILALPSHRTAVQGLAVLEEGNRLVVGSTDGDVRLWKLDDRR